MVRCAKISQRGGFAILLIAFCVTSLGNQNMSLWNRVLILIDGFRFVMNLSIGIPYRDILVYYNYIYIYIYYFYLQKRIGPSIGMFESAFEIGLSLPKINPAPLTNPEPPFLDTILPLHRLIQTPSMVLGKDLFRKVPSCRIFPSFDV